MGKKESLDKVVHWTRRDQTTAGHLRVKGPCFASFFFFRRASLHSGCPSEQSESADRSCERHTSTTTTTPRQSSHFRSGPDYESTVPCSTAAMKTPSEWAWERESHGHPKDKQLSFITAALPIHRTRQAKGGLMTWRHPVHLKKKENNKSFSKLDGPSPHPVTSCKFICVRIV